MKYKLLFLLLTFSSTCVYSMNETNYRLYVQDRISGAMEAIKHHAKTYPPYEGNGCPIG